MLYSLFPILYAVLYCIISNLSSVYFLCVLLSSLSLLAFLLYSLFCVLGSMFSSPYPPFRYSLFSSRCTLISNLYALFCIL